MMLQTVMNVCLCHCSQNIDTDTDTNADTLCQYRYLSMILSILQHVILCKKINKDFTRCFMIQPSFYYHKVIIKLQQNRSYAITNTPEQITRTRTRYKNLMDAGAQCSNSAEFSTELTGSQAQKQQYNIQLLFKIKHFVLTPAHKSQKRDKHMLFC